MTFFYDLNKKLQGVLDAPKSEHQRLDERDMGKHNNATTGFKAVAAKAAKEYGSKAAGERVAGAVKAKMAKAGKLEEADLDEGFVDTVKSGAQAALSAIGQTLGHGSDEDMIKDLQKKAGVPVTGKVPPQQPGQQPQGQQPVAEKTDPAAFAALAEPKDKITFADKIAGAKKEVDEMLGDVAAEAMKNALRGGQEVADEGNAFTGKLKSTPKGGKFKMGSKEYTDNSDIDEGWDDMLKDVKARREKTKKGEITHGHKHDIEDTGTGRRVTRRTDPNTGYSVGAEDDKPADGEKRGRGRPKKADKAPERVTAKATKHKGGRKMSKEEIDEAIARLEECGYEVSPLKEKAVSVAQQQAAGAALAAKRGEGKAKGPSKEMAKMSTKELKKFAGTKHKGLPKHKEEEVEESGTVAGSVAPAAGGKAKKGGVVGKGIYDSINRELEAMISESMNVSVNMNMDENGEPRKSITVSADGEAAEQLAQLLNLAGMAAQDHEHEEVCGNCGEADCGCEEMVDENAPDWPTDQETTGEDDPLMQRWAGGVNGPKSTGQTVGAPYNRQLQRQGVGADGVRESKDLGMKLYAELKSFKG